MAWVPSEVAREMSEGVIRQVNQMFSDEKAASVDLMNVEQTGWARGSAHG